jgi:broad specificity phosphatase PhoE
MTLRTPPPLAPAELVLWLVRHGSLRDLYWRVAAFADDLLSSSPPGEVAIVAHGGTVRVLTAYLRGVPVERMRWEPLANGTITGRRLQPAHS